MGPSDRYLWESRQAASSTEWGPSLRVALGPMLLCFDPPVGVFSHLFLHLSPSFCLLSSGADKPDGSRPIRLFLEQTNCESDRMSNVKAPNAGRYAVRTPTCTRSPTVEPWEFLWLCAAIKARPTRLPLLPSNLNLLSITISKTCIHDGDHLRCCQRHRDHSILRSPSPPQLLRNTVSAHGPEVPGNSQLSDRNQVSFPTRDGAGYWRWYRSGKFAEVNSIVS